MKLLVIVLCLLSERYLIHSVSHQRFSWFGDYYLFIKKTCDKKNLFINPWLVLALLVVPVVLITFFVYMLFHTVLFGFFGLIISLLLFFYCLGPQNVFYPLMDSDALISDSTFVATYLAKVNNQLFAVIFWYLVGGPIAALIYRLFSLCQEIVPVNQEARQIVDLLDWVPARMTVLLYLLVGNFQRGFPLFMRFFISNSDLNNQMLSQCGLDAVRMNDSDEVPIRAAEQLVEHALIVLLVCIALFTLAWW